MFEKTRFPANIYLFKVNNRNTRKGYEICTSFSSSWCFYSLLWIYFTPFSGVSIVDFEQVNVNWVDTLRPIFPSSMYPSYGNQPIDWQSKSFDWSLYDRNSFRLFYQLYDCPKGQIWATQEKLAPPTRCWLLRFILFFLKFTGGIVTRLGPKVGPSVACRMYSEDLWSKWL